jgi:hypothetical protein
LIGVSVGYTYPPIGGPAVTVYVWYFTGVGVATCVVFVYVAYWVVVVVCVDVCVTASVGIRVSVGSICTGSVGTFVRVGKGSGDVGNKFVDAGRSAINATVLLNPVAPAHVVYFWPVVPAVVRSWSAMYEVALMELLCDRTVIPAGVVRAVILLSIAAIKTSCVLACVVITALETIVHAPFSFTRPAWESIGAEGFTPLYATILPAAAVTLLKLQLYDMGSELVATL